MVSQGFLSVLFGRRTRRWSIVCRRMGFRRVVPLGGILTVVMRGGGARYEASIDGATALPGDFSESWRLSAEMMT